MGCEKTLEFAIFDRFGTDLWICAASVPDVEFRICPGSQSRMHDGDARRRGQERLPPGAAVLQVRHELRAWHQGPPLQPPLISLPGFQLHVPSAEGEIYRKLSTIRRLPSLTAH